MEKVWIAFISANDGNNLIWVAATKRIVLAKVYNYVKSQWDSLFTEEIPTKQHEAINQYFSSDRSGDFLEALERVEVSK